MEIPAKSDPNWPSIVGTEATGHYGRSILGKEGRNSHTFTSFLSDIK